MRATLGEWWLRTRGTAPVWGVVLRANNAAKGTRAVEDAAGPGGAEAKPERRSTVPAAVQLGRLQASVPSVLVAMLSDTKYSLISFRKSTPAQNRQLNILISSSKR